MTIKRIVELLEIERECILRNSRGDCYRDCGSCDLVQDDADLHEMYTDAIALLKANELRLVVEKDFEGADDDGFLPVWVEEIKTGRVYCDCVTMNIFDESSDEDYRFWTSKPRK